MELTCPCVKKMLLYNTMTPSVPIFNKKSFNYQNLVTTIVRFCTLLNVRDVMLLHSFKGDQLKSSSCNPVVFLKYSHKNLFWGIRYEIIFASLANFKTNFKMCCGTQKERNISILRGNP